MGRRGTLGVLGGVEAFLLYFLKLIGLWVSCLRHFCLFGLGGLPIPAYAGIMPNGIGMGNWDGWGFLRGGEGVGRLGYWGILGLRKGVGHWGD